MNKNLNARILLILILLFSLSGSLANARELYVAKNGSDNTDGSQNNPWYTIQKAATTADAGDIVYIKRGVYQEIVTVGNSGSPGKFIIFKEYPGHEVILDGSGNPGWHGVFSLYGRDYIKLEDIEIKHNATGWGILIEHEKGNVANAAVHIELSGLEVHHTGAEAIQLRGNINNVLVKNCVVHDANGPSGIDIYQWDGGRPHHVTVSGCTAYNFPKFAGIASEQADNLIIEDNTCFRNELGIDIGSGDKNIIRGNTIHHCADGIALSSNEYSQIYNNTIYDITNEAIYAYYWSAHGEAHRGNKWYNNVIYKAGFGIYESNQKGSKGRVGPTSDHEYFNNLFYSIGSHGSYRTPFLFKGTRGIKFYNNTVYMNANYNAIELKDGSAYADIQNNIISISGNRAPIIMDRASAQGSTIDFNCYHSRSDRVNGPGKHSVNGIPLFINPGNGDFNLQTGSPCIDAGTSEGNIPARDIEGNPRYDDSKTPNVGGGFDLYYDIGAYEYQGPAGTQ